MTDVQNRVAERRRQILDNRLEELFQDLQSVTQQMGQALSDADKNKLKRQRDVINKQIDETAAELENLAAQNRETNTEEANFNQAYLDIQAKLPEIDFRPIENALKTILRNHHQDGCAALLLLQRSTLMGGEWCAKRIHRILREKTAAGQCRRIELEFQSSERADGSALLKRLGAELGVEPGNQDLASWLAQVVEKLCGSLQSGSVVILEFRRCDYLSHNTRVFHWILTEFWRHVVRELRKVARRYYEVKVFALFFVDGTLPAHCLPPEHCCTIRQFHKERLLKIDLKRWTQEDIRRWIASYSGLSLSRDEVDRMAQKVHGATQGLPTGVIHELQNECCPAPAG
jgi:hypothetical protein